MLQVYYLVLNSCFAIADALLASIINADTPLISAVKREITKSSLNAFHRMIDDLLGGIIHAFAV